ncbi:MAG TPA: 16S rRNA (guanine(527)-N(7))-methyltransferase RsmG [Nitrospirae bacterium]|nr:16S rRNA (guanine(527)-N(7))-methyltransferase RsmG [Nitrospirota bacterium]HDZ01201.1 16S rRNA (guanine(527)-N(7))-methyltransferase RsmG [Nitrospirota bacterium]
MNTAELFKKGLKQIDISCSEGQINAFMTCLSELKKWNRAYNLTALKTDEEIIVKHFLDSLLYLRAIPEGAMKLADIGTGAGFPGIPVKIIRPETDITLIESSRKKAAFLRHIIRSLKLSAINVLEQRAEALTGEHEKNYDVILSRATFSIKEFLETACRYVKENGILILNKGPKVSEELKELERSPYAKGAVRETLKLPLPLTTAERNLIILSCRM